MAQQFDPSVGNRSSRYGLVGILAVMGGGSALWASLLAVVLHLGG